MKLDQITSMLRRDAVSASYGVAATVWRKGLNKVLGSRGVGETGTNLASLGLGAALSQASNEHQNNLGGALRIGSLVRVGNSLVESFFGSRSEKTENSKS